MAETTTQLSEVEALWAVALCRMAETGETNITLYYKTHGALVLAHGHWGIIPAKFREVLDKIDRARQSVRQLGVHHVPSKEDR
jgi:hypothetical protein